jgi:hypothetical protein
MRKRISAKELKTGMRYHDPELGSDTTVKEVKMINDRVRVESTSKRGTELTAWYMEDQEITTIEPDTEPTGQW